MRVRGRCYYGRTAQIDALLAWAKAVNKAVAYKKTVKGKIILLQSLRKYSPANTFDFTQ